MEIFRKIAGRRTKEAIDNGEFSNLSNEDKPPEFGNDAYIREDLRLSCRVLKKAGCIPSELELRNEIISLHSLINTLDDGRGRLKKMRELNVKLMKLGEIRKKHLNLKDFPDYERRLYERYL
ncbi:hypothetical protein BMS3Abin07_01867 [bacterium BMS3Abin07]|nr:hypothetical protein BMS3Abin07_01867 [bacterium BMS3Abin07]GBE32040.1 hypothetical protein BMS3Bbin05_00948 [bacterium BMS3Bbin05]